MSSRTWLTGWLLAALAGLPAWGAAAQPAAPVPNREAAAYEEPRMDPAPPTLTLRSLHMGRNHMARTECFQVSISPAPDGGWQMDAWFPRLQEPDVRCEQAEVPAAEVEALTDWLRTQFAHVVGSREPLLKPGVLQALAAPFVRDQTTESLSLRFEQGRVPDTRDAVPPQTREALRQRLQALAARLCGPDER